MIPDPLVNVFDSELTDEEGEPWDCDLTFPEDGEDDDDDED